jgi:hypothetical protein
MSSSHKLINVRFERTFISKFKPSPRTELQRRSNPLDDDKCHKQRRYRTSTHDEDVWFSGAFDALGMQVHQIRGLLTVQQRLEYFSPSLPIHLLFLHSVSPVRTDFRNMCGDLECD